MADDIHFYMNCMPLHIRYYRLLNNSTADANLLYNIRGIALVWLSCTSAACILQNVSSDFSSQSNSPVYNLEYEMHPWRLQWKFILKQNQCGLEHGLTQSYNVTSLLLLT